MWQHKSLAFLKIAVLMAVTFYAGVSYDEMRGLFANEFSESPSPKLPASPAFDVQPSDFKQLEFSSDDLARLRKELELKIYGRQRAAELPEVRTLDTKTFAEAYAGEEVFEKYYKRLLERGTIEIRELRGSFKEMQGYTWKSLLMRNRSEAGRQLFIIHQGHDGSPFSFRPANTLISHMLENDYDVLVLCMPGVGWNRVENIRIKTWDGWGSLSSLQEGDHAPFTMIDTGGGHFIKFFIEPVQASLDLALAQRRYEHVTMLGHSGGGWTTTLSAAIDARIDYSISYAGTLPFFARRKSSDLGDIEQYDSAFYRHFTYPMLYELASWGTGKKRIHYQVYSTEDACCFDRDSSTVFSAYLASRRPAPDRDLRMVVVENKGHYMVVGKVLEILQQIGLSQPLN